MIKFEVNGERVDGTCGRPEYRVEIKNCAYEGSVEQMMSEMGVVITRWLLATAGWVIAEKDKEDLDTFCALIERVGKVVLLSALVEAIRQWAEEHYAPVEEEDLIAGLAGSLGGKVQDEPAEQYIN